jgi:hypothetical protein
MKRRSSLNLFEAAKPAPLFVLELARRLRADAMLRLWSYRVGEPKSKLLQLFI